MTADETSLRALTGLLTEFYTESAAPERRRAIQDSLSAFEQRDDSWNSAFFYLGCTTSQHVALYCLKVIENVVIKRWSFLSDLQKSELRRCIQLYLFERTTIDYAHFLIRKAAKILSCIACMDWPHAYPNFIEDMKQYIAGNLSTNNLSKVTIGLFALRVSVEQLMAPSDSVSYTRKRQLHSLLASDALAIYNPLCDIITRLCGVDLLTSTGNLLQTASILQVDSNLSDVWFSVARLIASLVVDLTKESSLQCMTFLAWLECLNELIRIVPLHSISLPSLYTALYICTLLGSPSFLSACDLSSEQQYQQQAQLKTVNPVIFLTRISLCAFACLSEIVERKDLSAEHMNQQLFYIFPIVQCHISLITGDMLIPFTHTTSTISSSGAPISQQSDYDCTEFRLKLLDLARCLTTNYFCNLLDGPQGVMDPIQFLGTLHDFTFSFNDLDGFLSCLSMWSSCIQFMKQRLPSATPGHEGHPLISPRLRNALVSFGRTLLSRLFYSEAAVFLEALGDDDDLASDNECAILTDCTPEETIFKCIFSTDSNASPVKSIDICDFRLCLRETLQTLNVTITFVPEELVNTVLGRYYSTWNDYVSFIKSSDILNSNQSITNQDSSTLVRIHWTLCDYATGLQSVGFLLEHLRFFAQKTIENDNTLSGPDFLQSLLYGLQISRRLVAVLSTLSDQAIRSDLVQVIVQNMLTIQAIITGNYLSCGAIGAMDFSSDKLVLSASQRESFVMEMLCALEIFVLSANGDQPLQIPTSIRICATRLLHTVCCSTDLSNAITESISNSTATVNSQIGSQIQSSFRHIFDSICDSKQRSQLPLPVVRQLVRTFVFYFSLDYTSAMRLQPIQEADQLARKSLSSFQVNILSQFFTSCFQPQLVPSELMNNHKVHLTYLGLLNDVIFVMDSATSKARRIVFDVLRDCGVLDNVVTCVKTVLECPNDNGQLSAIRIHFCTAYLTFFATFVRVLSSSGSDTFSVIPTLLSQIVNALLHATKGSSFPVPLIDCLIDMLLLLSKNRRLFPSLVEHVLDLCFTQLLNGLASKSYENSQNGTIHLVCDAAFHNAASVKRLVELFFSILLEAFSFFFTIKNKGPSTSVDLFTPVSNRYNLERPVHFHRIMHLLTAVFHAEQHDTELVRVVLENLGNLHRVRKFYDLPEFYEVWLPELTKRMLNILVNKQHDALRDVIMDGLFHLMLSARMVSNLEVLFQVELCDSAGPLCFVSQLMLSYFSTLSYLKPEDYSSLATSLIPESTDSIDKRIQLLTCADVFAKSIEQLVIDLRHYRQKSTVSTSTVNSDFTLSV